MSGVITLSYTFDISESDVDSKVWAVLMKMSDGMTLEIVDEMNLGWTVTDTLDESIMDAVTEHINDAFSIPAEDSEEQRSLSDGEHTIYVQEDGETWSDAPPTKIKLSESEYEEVRNGLEPRKLEKFYEKKDLSAE